MIRDLYLLGALLIAVGVYLLLAARRVRAEIAAEYGTAVERQPVRVRDGLYRTESAKAGGHRA